jgi:hypothetical protein
MEAEKSQKICFPSVAETRIEAVLEATEDIPSGEVATATAQCTSQDSDERTQLMIVHSGPLASSDKDMEDVEDKAKDSGANSNSKAGNYCKGSVSPD